MANSGVIPYYTHPAFAQGVSNLSAALFPGPQQMAAMKLSTDKAKTLEQQAAIRGRNYHNMQTAADAIRNGADFNQVLAPIVAAGNDKISAEAPALYRAMVANDPNSTAPRIARAWVGSGLQLKPNDAMTLADRNQITASQNAAALKKALDTQYAANAGQEAVANINQAGKSQRQQWGYQHPTTPGAVLALNAQRGNITIPQMSYDATGNGPAAQKAKASEALQIQTMKDNTSSGIAAGNLKETVRHDKAIEQEKQREAKAAEALKKSAAGKAYTPADLVTMTRLSTQADAAMDQIFGVQRDPKTGVVSNPKDNPPQAVRSAVRQKAVTIMAAAGNAHQYITPQAATEQALKELYPRGFEHTPAHGHLWWYTPGHEIPVPPPSALPTITMPGGKTITPQDIQFTAQKYGQTPQQVIDTLKAHGGQPGA